MKPIFLVYGIWILIGLFIYIYGLLKLKANKRIIGEIYYKWSFKFNIEFARNWINWAIVIAYLIWSFSQLTKEFHTKVFYTNIVIFFALFLSFYPRWNIFIGSKGIIYGTQAVLWEKLKEWKLIRKGRRSYLELKFRADDEFSNIIIKRIRIPSKIWGNLEKIIKDASPLSR